MKLIERFAFYERTNNVPAGSYASTPVLTVDVNFNLILTGVYISVLAEDTVTNQAIDAAAHLYVPVPISNLDSPGITVTTYQRQASASAKTGRAGFTECHHNLEAGLTMSPNISLRLFTVTANIIAVRTVVGLRYLCPEDYLSIEGRLLSPQ